MATLTTAQKTALKNDITAKQANGQPLAGVTDEQAIATYYNTSVGTYIVWKSAVTVRETGQVFDGAEWAGMTSANHTRLQTVAQYLMSYSPAIAGVRAMFNDIWSGAGGTNTRAALLVLWKRAGNRLEALFATGTGTDASPATLVVEGTVTAQQISDVIAGQ